MDIPDSKIEILTLGRFSISVNGKAVSTDWPDEATKVLFCSLLSPLDLYFSWDRICRSIWGESATRTGMRRLQETVIRPLNSFLVREIGFNPMIAGADGIKIDQQSVHIDVFEFFSTVLEGLRQLSLDNKAEAFEKFRRADSLYVGRYLPGIPGKIIANTRNDIETLYRSAVMNSMPSIRNSFSQNHPKEKRFAL